MNRMDEFTVNIEQGLMDVTANQFVSHNINPAFPEEIARLQVQDLSVEESSHRKDYRGEKAFTIDCEDCKDMDDAVSVIKTSSGYRLAVHIADVSAYIPLGSELDCIASDRATSIYLPHLTVPMLPEILSNNLCSLNSGESRHTLSVIIHLNHRGEVLRSEITKGIIRSRVKGVYREINRLLCGNKDTELMEKYKEVYEEIFTMANLYKVLRMERIQRGGRCDDSLKPKISILKNEVQITQSEKGVAENMIEEFMILANRIVAEYLYENNLPAIFRIQEEKNHLAAYQSRKMHHAELALECYSHFTSPIRRISDLKIHQVLSMHLSGRNTLEIHQLFDEVLNQVCERATKRSRTVNQIQKKCELYCYQEYFRNHKEDSYIGRVIGFDCKERPIVRLNQYNVSIVGDALINAVIGEQYSFKVRISDDQKELFTYSPAKLAS